MKAYVQGNVNMIFLSLFAHHISFPNLATLNMQKIDTHLNLINDEKQQTMATLKAYVEETEAVNHNGKRSLSSTSGNTMSLIVMSTNILHTSCLILGEDQGELELRSNKVPCIKQVEPFAVSSSSMKSALSSPRSFELCRPQPELIEEELEEEVEDLDEDGQTLLLDEYRFVRVDNGNGRK